MAIEQRVQSRATGQVGHRLRSVVDEALEATVVLSWSRLGYLVRRRLWSWAPPAPSMGSAVALVTGGTRGIGRSLASSLASLGASVGVVGRRRESAEAAAWEIGRESGSPRVWAEVADMSSLGQVRALAERVTERVGRVDVLVHNAGLLHRTRQLSDQGVESTAATHVLGPHLLTAALAPLLEAARPSKVIWMSSGGMYLQRLDVELLDSVEDRYRPAVVYARAKRAQVALAGLWAERLGPAGVRAYVMHPGWVDTGALAEGLPRFRALLRPLLRTPEQGADTAVWLASGQGPAAGPVGFWLDRRPRPTFRFRGPDQAGEGERLWAWCEERVG
jgi:dehydrogenase/reductase SDR family member 12